MFLVIEAGLKLAIEGFGGLMEFFAGRCVFIEVEDVEFFEQQQRLSADKFCHVEGCTFLFCHRDAHFGGFLRIVIFLNCDADHN